MRIEKFKGTNANFSMQLVTFNAERYATTLSCFLDIADHVIAR